MASAIFTKLAKQCQAHLGSSAHGTVEVLHRGTMAIHLCSAKAEQGSSLGFDPLKALDSAQLGLEMTCGASLWDLVELLICIV